MNEVIPTGSATSPNGSTINEALVALRAEVARLTERVAALERGKGREARDEAQGEPSALASSSSLAPHPSSLAPQDDELLAVIAAAIAAFLGKTPRIRQIRLVGTTTWAQQGRVTIQTSHALPHGSAAGNTRSER